MFLLIFRDKVNFLEEKLSFYRELNENDRSSNRDDAEAGDEQHNEFNLKNMGSAYRMLKIEIDLVLYLCFSDLTSTGASFLFAFITKRKKMTYLALNFPI